MRPTRAPIAILPDREGRVPLGEAESRGIGEPLPGGACLTPAGAPRPSGTPLPPTGAGPGDGLELRVPLAGSWLAITLEESSFREIGRDGG